MTPRHILLSCGIAASLIYVATDLVASRLYPGFSARDQAVSELFAIGAPTSALVVPLFSLASLLLAAFALGIWQSAGGNRRLHLLGWMVLGNALNGLLLWTAFPMHMRGDPPGFTDTMHLILAVNPFVLLSLVFAGAAFRDWMRAYTIATALVMVSVAALAFRHAPALGANLPTPGLGLTERAAQYLYMLWQAVLAVRMMRRS